MQISSLPEEGRQTGSIPQEEDLFRASWTTATLLAQDMFKGFLYISAFHYTGILKWNFLRGFYMATFSFLLLMPFSPSPTVMSGSAQACFQKEKAIVKREKKQQNLQALL